MLVCVTAMQYRRRCIENAKADSKMNDLILIPDGVGYCVLKNILEADRYHFVETDTDILKFSFTDIWPVADIRLTTDMHFFL